MRPKKRELQRQRGRMFLRSKDHRDIVYNDNYYNGMLWVDENGEETIWHRYPQKCALEYVGNDVGIIDLKRAFRYSAFNITGQQSMWVQHLHDFTLVQYSYASSPRTSFITKDGVNWKQITLPYVCRYIFNDNSVCSFEASPYGNNISGNVVNILEDENGDYYTQTSSFSFLSPYSGNYPIGDTHNGLLVLLEDRDSVVGDTITLKIYRISNELTFDYLGDIERAPFVFNHRGILFKRRGSFYTFARVYTISYGNPYNPTRNDCITAYGSADDGHTWSEPYGIYRSPDRGQYSGWDATNIYYANICLRNGRFLVYYCNNENQYCECHASSNGSSWYQINMPQYVTVPIEQNPSGYGTKDTPTYQNIRVVIDRRDGLPDLPPLDVSADLRLMLADINDRAYADGEVSEDEDYMIFNNGNYIVCFDNEALTVTEDSFALEVGSSLNPYEYLMEGDYCYRGGEPSPYPYWNPYTEYQIGEIVNYGNLWICLTANKGIAPIEGTYWHLYTRGD